ncbi:MAG: formylglycine-generating enzyme family protein [Pirellula sp.]|nr:formylglycine-generating enzyme family protein [Pirellula sp.]
MPNKIIALSRLKFLVVVLVASIEWTAPAIAVTTEDAGSVPVGIVTSKPTNGIAVELHDGRWMVSYQQTIRNGKVSFEMIPIPGGTFRIGSPNSELGRSDDEGPQVEVQVPPFWIGKTEVTWNEFQVYQLAYAQFKEQDKKRKFTIDHLEADAVTAPTPIYDPSMVYAYGKGNQPAISMSQYSAMQYTKWLSLATGGQYRLPSEAEWEYACRGGAQTKYSFGDDQAELAEFAHFLRPTAGTEVDHVGTKEVGSKKPNSFGIYDMHGNVAEWVMDQYFENAYEMKAKEPIADRYRPLFGTDANQKVLRGGGWQDEASRLRAAARFVGTEELWDNDPFIPVSPHWLASEKAQSIGFRIARSLEELPESEISMYWNAQGELRKNIESRLKEGRGVIGKPIREKSSQRGK